MAQTTILAAGNTTATSSNVVITTAAKLVGMFVAAGPLTADIELAIVQATPGADIPIGKLTRDMPTVALTAPGTYRVIRPARADVTVGVFQED